MLFDIGNLHVYIESVYTNTYETFICRRTFCLRPIAILLAQPCCSFPEDVAAKSKHERVVLRCLSYSSWLTIFTKAHGGFISRFRFVLVQRTSCDISSFNLDNHGMLQQRCWDRGTVALACTHVVYWPQNAVAACTECSYSFIPRMLSPSLPLRRSHSWRRRCCSVAV